MKAANQPRTVCPPPNALITRVWKPEDGHEVLTEIVRSVIASGGAIITQIPAMAFTADDPIGTGTRTAQPNRVA